MTQRSATDAGAATRGWLLLVVPTACLVLLYSLLWLVAILLGGTVLLQLDPVVLTSGSMEPGAARGDVVLVEPHDGSELESGTVITFDDPAEPGHLITHRVDALLPDGGYRTKGDANRGPDSTPVPADAIVGTGKLLVPMVALPVIWAQDGQFHLLALLAAVVGVACLGARLPEEPGAVPSVPRAAGVRVRTLRRVGIADPSGLQWGQASFTSRTPPTRAAPAEPLREEPTGAVLAQPRTDEPVRRRHVQDEPTFDLTAGVWHARRRPAPSATRLAWAGRGLGNLAVIATIIASVSVAPAPRAWAALGSAASTGGSWGAATIAAPTGLAAVRSCLLDPRVELAWVASVSTGVDGYEVWRSNASGGPYDLIATTSPLETSYTDANLATGQSYYYVVTATDDPWRSADSDEVAISGLCL